MNEAAIFGIGSVVFSLTTWATLAFGMRRAHELQMRDLDASGRISEVRSGQLTELHMTIDAEPTNAPTPADSEGL